MNVDALTEGMDRYAGRGVTTYADWFRGEGRLVGVYRRGQGKDAWRLLAYGLEYRQRLGAVRLDLVLPHEAARHSAMRVALLDPQLDIHLHVQDAKQQLTLIDPMELDEAIGAYRQLGGIGQRPDPDDISPLPPWLQELADWVETRRVERIRMRGYYSWHFRGRQVLRVRRSTGTWELTAGVAYKTPTGNQPTVRTVGKDGPLSDGDTEALRAAIDDAIENRRIGKDRGHRESLLQAAIGVDPATIGLMTVDREVPAWRPQGRGKIDFLGFDEDGRPHVVETKIGPDPQLGIQGLDYWAWTRAHQREFVDGLVDGQGDVDAEPSIRFVLGTSNKALLHAAAAATLEAIRPTIDWRVQVIQDWDMLDPTKHLLRPSVAERLRPRTLPDRAKT